MHMKHLLILPIILLFLGCELVYQHPEPGAFTHVAIGLNYRGTNANALAGTINDAREQEAAFTSLFSDRNPSSYLMLQEGTSDGSYDDVSSPLLPTKERVRKIISSLVAAQQAQDILLITYSGHGMEDGSWVLAPETASGTIFLDASTVDPFLLLSVDELFALLAPAAGTTLLIIDSCYAGNFVQESGSSVSLIDLQPIFADAYETYFSKGKYKNRTFVMAATTADNTSKEPIGGSHIHGYFTEALLGALGWDEETQSLAPDTSSLSMDDLYRYIMENQRIKLTGTYQAFYQHPTISGGPLDLVLRQEVN
ncbi:MAG: caspase family protein [Sphaerochaeta associata]|uniref:caspase family protein n=1 Tax=Sphaerochaeta associata TaxID=1129264 RepID=UPI002B1FDC95|nr:caspase family protein [Sphaerochaeta associata]MEA5029985.1 caspase family protein [Sphaerochaeta associata]